MQNQKWDMAKFPEIMNIIEQMFEVDKKFREKADNVEGTWVRSDDEDYFEMLTERDDQLDEHFDKLLKVCGFKE